MRFCEYMRRMMQQHNYTLGQVEYMTGLASSTVYQNFHGIHLPSKKNFLKYLAVFHSRCDNVGEVYTRFKEEEIKYKKSV